VEVRGGVAVFGGIATTDLPTFQTHAEMNPGVSDLETFLATLGVRLHFLQMIFYVRALCCGHGILFLCARRAGWPILDGAFPARVGRDESRSKQSWYPTLCKQRKGWGTRLFAALSTLPEAVYGFTTGSSMKLAFPGW
jgi:hypothetical protein